MPRTFTTLRHPVEKLLEAEHFLARMVESDGLKFQFELNAFLSASRSVTFVLQKALADVPGFAVWYEQQQARMKADAAMRFFLDLRNVSQSKARFLLWVVHCLAAAGRTASSVDHIQCLRLYWAATLELVAPHI